MQSRLLPNNSAGIDPSGQYPLDWPLDRVLAAVVVCQLGDVLLAVPAFVAWIFFFATVLALRQGRPFAFGGPVANDSCLVAAIESCGWLVSPPDPIGRLREESLHSGATAATLALVRGDAESTGHQSAFYLS